MSLLNPYCLVLGIQTEWVYKTWTWIHFDYDWAPKSRALGRRHMLAVRRKWGCNRSAAGMGGDDGGDDGEVSGGDPDYGVYRDVQAAYCREGEAALDIT